MNFNHCYSLLVVALPGELPADDMRFNEAVEKYTMAVAPRKKRNTQRLDQEIGGRLIRYFDGKSLQTITSKDIAAYRDYRLQQVGPSSVIQDLSFLPCMYRLARIEWGRDVNDPDAEIRRPLALRGKVCWPRPSPTLPPRPVLKRCLLRQWR